VITQIGSSPVKYTQFVTESENLTHEHDVVAEFFSVTSLAFFLAAAAFRITHLAAFVTDALNVSNVLNLFRFNLLSDISHLVFR
jgi:hypothetical protein